jgi:hypothetical protein
MVFVFVLVQSAGSFLKHVAIEQESVEAISFFSDCTMWPWHLDTHVDPPFKKSKFVAT